MTNDVAVIDSGRDYTTIQMMDIVKGEITYRRNVKGSFKEQSRDLLNHIIKTKPTKVIFEKYGVGKGLSEAFSVIAKDFGMNVKENGTVEYK